MVSKVRWLFANSRPYTTSAILNFSGRNSNNGFVYSVCVRQSDFHLWSTTNVSVFLLDEQVNLFETVFMAASMS